ncbi:hypothetical protein [Alteromonas sp. H39]|uniref:hypothetical protein n=1 Tax=Alteromonas sp. H39 TaxID=3389876 RepID=UPI0039E02241
MNKIGTSNNPLKLVPDINRRLLFEDATGIGIEDDGIVTTLSRMKMSKLPSNLYLHNLMHNPRLTAQELRLAYLVYDLLENQYFEPVFLLVEKSKYRMSSVGDGGMLFLHDRRQVPSGVEYLEKESLLEISKKVNLDIDTKGLIQALNRLHSFFYITCTEICELNSANNRQNFDYNANEVLLSDDSQIVHIRLNGRFSKFDLTKKWKEA